jgi:acyl homoserine lactone synthase
MALHIQIASRRDFKSRDLREMHTLRAKVFKDRLGWEVPIMSGMEIDGYDALEPMYMMMREPDGGVLRGCWRLLPTEGRFGFSEITMESIGEIISHGYHAGIDQYVTVTTTAIERLLRRAGVVTRRFGAPLQIGVEKAVALYIDIAATHAVMFDTRLAS